MTDDMMIISKSEAEKLTYNYGAIINLPNNTFEHCGGTFGAETYGGTLKWEISQINGVFYKRDMFPYD